jgi:hypothetical protein
MFSPKRRIKEYLETKMLKKREEGKPEREGLHEQN